MSRATEGQRLGRYHLATKIATGGMAEIFLAYEEGVGGLERMVVVKRILPHLVDLPHFVDMFLREARIVARLSHPNVVQIHELGEVDGAFFIAMEYIHGSTVRELCLLAEDSDSPMPLEVAVSVILQACRGAHAAHNLKDMDGSPLELVHRDISPHNLMVTDHGDVKLLDFGVAKATASSREATYSGSVKGKFAYMSPEQCRGEPLDRRSDVFALGVVLWEMCAGETLFRHPTELETLSAITETDAPPLSERRPDAPPPLERVLARALSRDREARPPSADALRLDLIKAAREAGLRLGTDVIADFVTEAVGEDLELRKKLLRLAKERPLLTEERARLVHRTGTTDMTGDLDPTRAERPSSIGRGDSRPGGPATPGGPEAQEGPASAPEPEPEPEPALPGPEPSGSPRRLLTVGLVGLALLGLAGLVAASLLGGEPPGPDGAANPAALHGEPVTIGFAPTVDTSVLKEEIEPLRQYFEAELGRPVEMSITRDYAELSAKLRAGEIDFASLPPLLFVRTRLEEPGVDLLAVKEFDGAHGSNGYLLVRADGDASTLADLEGERFCFTDENSTTGNFLPRIFISDSGYDVDTFIGDVHWSGDHIQVLRDLLAGRCAAAATYSGALHVADDLDVAVGQLRVLAITGYVPQDLISASPEVDPALKRRFKKALLDFDPREDAGVDSLGQTQRITGFSEPKPNAVKALEGLEAMAPGNP